MYRTFGVFKPKMRYIRQNRGADSAARAGGLGLTAPPHEPERGLTAPPHEADLIHNLTRKQGKEPMEPPIEVTDLKCKKRKKKHANKGASDGATLRGPPHEHRF